MRRLVALFVIALLAATLYGASNHASGLRVNDVSLSGSTVRSELAALSKNFTLRCYLTAVDPVSFSPGAGGDSITAAGAAVWASLRVEGLAIDQYATSRGFSATASQLATAKASLVNEFNQAAATKQYNCKGTGDQALAEMTPEMRRAQIESQAASLAIVGSLNATIPLTTSSLQSYYSSHVSSYDTLCVSVALVPTAQLGAFNSARSTGASVSALAQRYSSDPSGARGGAYGCYGPTSSSYSGVRADTVSIPINTFPATGIPYNQGASVLFVAVTKRTVTPFALAESAVVTDVQHLNSTSANTVKQDILYRAAIAVDPSFGRWTLGTGGFSVATPSLPASGDVGSASTLSTASSSTYK